jgi:hypothetical protein
MPIYEDTLPLTPVLPWERPRPTRNRKGQWMRGVSGNPKGRPTNAQLRTKALANDAHAKRFASYGGITGPELAKVATAAYGRFWQTPLAADLMMSKQGMIRWVQGVHKISLEKEILALAICLRRAQRNHTYVRAMYRRAVAHRRALMEQEQMPRYRRLTYRSIPRTVC